MDDDNRQVDSFTDRNVSQNEDRMYKDVHLKAYTNVGMQWPPARYDTKDFRVAHLTTRSFEVIHLCHNVFPYAQKELPDGAFPPEYLDVNPSMERHVNVDDVKARNPWATKLMCLTCASQVIVRKAEQVEVASGVFDIHTKVFQLDGVEAMQVIGFDRDFYRDRDGWPTHRLGMHMAGNAFSAFAAMPIFSAVVSALGLPTDEEMVQSDTESDCLGL